jgi:hypothetical protein
MLGASGALAAGTPASVTVRVAGLTHSLAPTAVTTTATPISENGNPCSGTSAGGALDGAVGHANWDADLESFGGGFSGWVLNSIDGEAYDFSTPAFWSIYVNGLSSENDVCSTELNPGDHVLFAAICDPFVSAPAGSVCLGEPLELSVPATVAPGQPFVATVTESNTDSSSGLTTIGPSLGATVTADGASATTDAAGHATLTVTDAGPISVHATKGTRVDDTQTTCSTTGADGACGSALPTAPGPGSPVGAQSSTQDSTPPQATIASIAEHHDFAKGHGPRTLSGTAADPESGIRLVALRLTRTNRGHCSTFVASKGTFEGIHCGAANGQWFRAGTGAAWSYLLPSALGSGRYVLDVRVTDNAGIFTTRLDPGLERAVFTVG